jgi:hypothetical protein
LGERPEPRLLPALNCLAFAYNESVGIIVESDEFLNHNDGIFRGRLALVRCVTEWAWEWMRGLNYRNAAKRAVFDSIHHRRWDFREVAGKEVIVLSIDDGR